MSLIEEQAILECVSLMSITLKLLVHYVSHYHAILVNYKLIVSKFLFIMPVH